MEAWLWRHGSELLVFMDKLKITVNYDMVLKKRRHNAMSIFECNQEIRELQKKKRQLVKDRQKSCELAGDVSEIDKRVKQVRKKTSKRTKGVSD